MWIHWGQGLHQDDRVAVNSSTSITFSGGTCLGGHGLSIGSANAGTDSSLPRNVRIRVKARSGETGEIEGVTYSGITLVSISKYGILIEQSYDCGDLHGDPTSAIRITDLTLGTISGSGARSFLKRCQQLHPVAFKYSWGTSTNTIEQMESLNVSP
ncbi:pectin lyase fold/virulence factor [Aspergillus recurvatus]